jgi:hypothetical protein
LLAVDGLIAAADRKEWRELLLKEIRFAEQAADIEKKKLDAGRSTVEVVAPLQRDVLALRRELLEFDARPAEPATNAAAAVTPPGSVTTERRGGDSEDQVDHQQQPGSYQHPELRHGSAASSSVRGQLVVARFLLDNGALVDQPTPQTGQ